MQKFILYIVFSLDEVYECAYSILKYLEVYNLKPPADHSLIVYTDYPELLEAYGSFFHEFELKPVPAGLDKETIKKEFTESTDGKLVYFENNTYPVKKLEETFQNSQKDESIESYANLKEFRTLLKDFFGRYQEESIPNQVKLIRNIDPKEIESQKKAFERLPLAAKWFRKMIGKGWNISNYLVRI